MATQLPSQLHRAYSGSRRAINTMSSHVTERTALLSNGVNGAHGTKDDDFTWRDWPAHTLHVTWHTLKSNPVNFLLVFVPLGIVGGAIGWAATTVFILNFFAIIPLASLLSFATEQLAARVGPTVGGLLNATFGNAVELIVSIVALKNGEIRIVQSSMLGSMLSNMLLVLGCCFLAGGLNPRAEPEQSFNMTAAQTMAGLLGVAAASLIIPATLYAVMSETKVLQAARSNSILVLSHGTAIILLILYGFYLFFQLKSHKKVFEVDEGAQGENGQRTSAETSAETPQQVEAEEEAEEDEVKLSPISSGVVLVVITVLVAICAEYLVDSIDDIVEAANISKTFIGLILLPIVGNAAEHVTAVVVSYKNKMNLAIGVAIGSSLQIALGVTPMLVILGWAMDTEMTLHFQTFETVIFFVSVLVVNYLIQDGKSNYLEGAMLLGIYIIIALAFYIYPDDGSIGVSWLASA